MSSHGPPALPTLNSALQLFVFFFFLGNWKASPAKVVHTTAVCFIHSSLYASVLFEKGLLSFRIMPITNGDAMTDTSSNALDYSKALEVLKNEYAERDGIDAKTLIDSKKNGGLTYNDFLMLPGYIGALFPQSHQDRLRSREGIRNSRYLEHRSRATVLHSSSTRMVAPLQTFPNLSCRLPCHRCHP
jgi:hypothetical protein